MRINLGKISVELSIDEYIELVNSERMGKLLENLSSLELASSLVEDKLFDEEDYCKTDGYANIEDRLFGIKTPDGLGDFNENPIPSEKEHLEIKKIIEDLFPNLKDNLDLTKYYLFE